MPYASTSDLPTDQTDQYSEHQKEVFRAAFNNAYEHAKGKPPAKRESYAFAVAHAAAKRAK